MTDIDDEVSHPALNYDTQNTFSTLYTERDRFHDLAELSSGSV
jgi:hypothetical protein